MPPQLFPEQKGREQQDQHRPHIVEQRGKTDVQQPVRLKQGDPVQTQRRPAEKEGDALGAAVGAVKAAAQQDHGRQHRAADERAQQHDLTGRERKTRDKQAVRAENQHGQQIKPVVKQRGAVFRGGLFVVHSIFSCRAGGGRTVTRRAKASFPGGGPLWQRAL